MVAFFAPGSVRLVHESPIMLTWSHARNFQPQLEEVRAGGDVHAAIVGVAEREVRRAHAGAGFARRLRQMQTSDRFPLR